MIIEFLHLYRIQIATLVILIYLLWVLRKIRVHLPKIKIHRIPRRIPVELPPEQRVVEAETAAKKFEGEVERLQLALAKYKAKEIKQYLEAEAERRIKTIIPEKAWLLDSRQTLIGRPIYYFGGVPLIDVEEQVELICEKYRLIDFMKPLIKKIVKWLHFDGDTLYWWSARLLPNGKWSIIAVSKKPKKTRKYIKIKRGTIPYILITASRESLDELILNKWEAVNLKASIILSSTFLGPFPLERFSKITGNLGWPKLEEEVEL